MNNVNALNIYLADISWTSTLSIMYFHHNRDAQGNPIIVIDNKIVITVKISGSINLNPLNLNL